MIVWTVFEKRGPKEPTDGRTDDGPYKKIYYLNLPSLFHSFSPLRKSDLTNPWTDEGRTGGRIEQTKVIFPQVSLLPPQTFTNKCTVGRTDRRTQRWKHGRTDRPEKK